MPRPRRLSPCARVSGWPNEPSADADVEVARRLAVNLGDAIAGRSIREIGRIAGVDPVAIGRVLRGETWPDLQTVARLEAGLASDLWPQGTARRTD